MITDSIHDKQQKHASNEKRQGVGCGSPMEDFVVLWVWGFFGGSHRTFSQYVMGMGIKIQSPRHRWRGSVTVGRRTCDQ